MQVIVLCEDGTDPVAIEVPFDSDSDLVIQVVMAETGKNIQQHYLEFNGKPLGTGIDNVKNIGIVDGSALLMKSINTLSPQPNRNISIHDIPSNIKPEELLSLTSQHPSLLAQFEHADSELGQCLASKNLSAVRSLMMKRLMNRHKQEYQHKQDLLELQRDPMNPDIQRRIEEAIRMENIQENMAAAFENLPEAFGRVTMLYVDIEVNSHRVKAFVDSGAQSTIMSKACAERCNITRLIDTRFAGEARGVGTAKIIGRVHIAQMKFGNSVFPISITILENDDVDFLFGLDTLRRYRCSIDLNKNVLRIEGVNGHEEVPFLSESELPDKAKGTYENH